MIVDIDISPKYYNYFSEFPPIFVNNNVSHNKRNNPITQNAHKTQNGPNGPINKKRKLVSVYKVKKVLLISPLLHWYVNHELLITKICRYIPANPEYIYKNFGDWVANERRKGKAEKAFETKAECANLIYNLAYGSTILNKEKLQSTKICNETNFIKHIYNPFLKDFQEYGDTIDHLIISV